MCPEKLDTSLTLGFFYAPSALGLKPRPRQASQHLRTTPIRFLSLLTVWQLFIVFIFFCIYIVRGADPTQVINRVHLSIEMQGILLPEAVG